MKGKFESIAFASAIVELGMTINFSVTSWGRTPKRSVEVGGIHNDSHTLWLAVDVVLDQPSDQPQFLTDARNRGLYCIIEKDHIHLQPLDLKL